MVEAHVVPNRQRTLIGDGKGERLRQWLVESTRSPENAERRLVFGPLTGSEERQWALSDGAASHEGPKTALAAFDAAVGFGVFVIRSLLTEVEGALGGSRGQTTRHGYALAPSGSRQRLHRSRPSLDRMRKRRSEPHPSQRT